MQIEARVDENQEGNVDARVEVPIPHTSNGSWPRFARFQGSSMSSGGLAEGSAGSRASIARGWGEELAGGGPASRGQRTTFSTLPRAQAPSADLDSLAPPRCESEPAGGSPGRSGLVTLWAWLTRAVRQPFLTADLATPAILIVLPNLVAPGWGDSAGNFSGE